MKKTLTYLTLILFPAILFAQQSALIDTIMPVDEHDMIVYSEVIEVEGNPDELYDRAMVWFKEYFPNPTGVMRKKDKENFVITGNTRLRFYEVDRKGREGNLAGLIHFDIKLEFKEGRYRFTFDDFTFQTRSDYPLERWIDTEGPYYNEANLVYLMQINKQVEAMIDALEEAMMPVDVETDEW